MEHKQLGFSKLLGLVEMDRQKLLYRARDFGAEARANCRSNIMTKADRDDLTYAAGISRWGDIPEDLRRELQAAFVEGYKSESKYHI